VAERISPREERAIVYEWLSSLFIAPLSAAQIAAYRSGAGAELLAALGEEPSLAPGIAAIRHALEAFPAEARAGITLNHAYVSLFLGAGGPETVPPYESVYGSEFARVCQEPMVRMEALLRRLGLRVGADCREPADHLAIELAAQAALLRRLDRADSEADRCDSRELLCSMLGWIPDFATLCQKLDRTGFYAGAAAVLAAFLAAEYAERDVTDHPDSSKERVDDDASSRRAPELTAFAAPLPPE